MRALYIYIQTAYIDPVDIYPVTGIQSIRALLHTHSKNTIVTKAHTQPCQVFTRHWCKCESATNVPTFFYWEEYSWCPPRESSRIHIYVSMRCWKMKYSIESRETKIEMHGNTHDSRRHRHRRTNVAFQNNFIQFTKRICILLASLS